jgi:ATP-binding cassette, subfamily F, member 3
MAGELSPDLGSVFLSEKASIGYFGQTNISSLHDDHTIEEEIATSNTTLNYTAIRSICGAMMFSKDSAKKKISLLSGGERSRVLLGKILASKTNLLLLDEPTHHLDIESIESLLDAILTFEGSVILVTHSEEMLHRIDTDALIVFKENGPELFLGSYAEFLEKDGWGDSPKKAKKNKKDLSKKDRALAVQKRSLELGPIKSKVESLEKKVEAKEKELKDTERLLVKASEVQDSQKIQTLSVSSATFQKELETLYKELEESYEHLESRKP